MTMKGEFYKTVRVLGPGTQPELERIQYYVRAVADTLKKEYELKFDFKGFVMYYNNVL